MAKELIDGAGNDDMAYPSEPNQAKYDQASHVQDLTCLQF